MNDELAGLVPEGFQAIPAGLGFTDVIQPSFVRICDGEVSFGIVAGASHGNSMGIVHGGVLMTLADVAAACAINVVRGGKTGTPTVNLSMDFISAGRIGQWLQADVERASAKRRFGFSNGVISSSDGLVARFNGTFYIPDHDGMAKDGKARASILDHLNL
jgi:uncharacterized protein (TIGR00369 family)